MADADRKEDSGPAGMRSRRSRLEDLRRKLEDCGLALRDDSRLAWLYASDSLPGGYAGVDDVVCEMGIVQDLHLRTSYGATCEAALRIAAERLVSSGLCWADAWDALKRGPDVVKYVILDRIPCDEVR